MSTGIFEKFRVDWSCGCGMVSLSETGNSIMAMYIERTNKHCVMWRVGCPIPDIMEDDVIEIQADGDELEYIIRNFPYLPYPKHKRVVKWRGDLAKLIAYNL